VHLEPAETDLNLPVHPAGRPAHDDRSDRDDRAGREGLPAAFKMRHGRHYVEQLMGDAPLRTVREIAVADVDAPEAEPADVDELQRSIQDVGILQPLLVSQSGTRFHIIAGANRYRAAVQLGLRTVPCLVCDTNTHTVESLREAAMRRAAPAVSPELPMPATSDDSQQTPPAASGLREVTARLAFVSAVMPALDVAGYDPLRWNVLTDLMKVEMERARSTAAAVEWLSASTLHATREPLDAGELVDAVLDATDPEARLQGVRLDVESSASGYRIPADRTMLVRALTGLVQSMLSLSAPGSALRVECCGTTVRPALIFTVSQDTCEVDDAAIARFFDAEFADHPGGGSGAVVLAGVALVARLHGGRAHARRLDGGGCAATFVIPKPLEN
jgi:hypothetical protein